MSKFGRSSKPSPRFLVVVSTALLRATAVISLRFLQTSRTLYIVVNAASKDGGAVMSVERRLNLSSIKSVAMSSLRDDWIVGLFVLVVSVDISRSVGLEHGPHRRRRPPHPLCIQDGAYHPSTHPDAGYDSGAHWANVRILILI